MLRFVLFFFFCNKYFCFVFVVFENYVFFLHKQFVLCFFLLFYYYYYCIFFDALFLALSSAENEKMQCRLVWSTTNEKKNHDIHWYFFLLHTHLIKCTQIHSGMDGNKWNLYLLVWRLVLLFFTLQFFFILCQYISCVYFVILFFCFFSFSEKKMLLLLDYFMCMLIVWSLLFCFHSLVLRENKL